LDLTFDEFINMLRANSKKLADLNCFASTVGGEALSVQRIESTRTDNPYRYIAQCTDDDVTTYIVLLEKCEADQIRIRHLWSEEK